MENNSKDMYRTPTKYNWPVKLEIKIDKSIIYNKELELKYATNPHHAAAIFNPSESKPLFKLVKSGKGGPPKQMLMMLINFYKLALFLP